jgi:hypothetical protein
MSTDTPEPRIIASVNVGTSEHRSYAIVALVENPLAAGEWFEQLGKRFKQAGDDAAMAVAEAKARLTSREQAVAERENAAEQLLIKLQEKMDAIKALV